MLNLELKLTLTTVEGRHSMEITTSIEDSTIYTMAKPLSHDKIQEQLEPLLSNALLVTLTRWRKMHQQTNQQTKDKQ